MKRMVVSGVVLTLLLISVLTLAFNIQHAKADGSWVWVRDTVTGAYGEAVIGTGTALYIARGTSFYYYRPADNSWIQLASPPKPDGAAFKTGTALAWDFGDYIYALYGAATDDSRRWFYRYSISNNSWEALANTPVDQGEGDAMTWVDINNCIYATIGGEQRPTYFVSYNPSTNSWSDAPADPLASMGDGASLVWTNGNFLFALRGEFYEESPLYDFWRYSLTDDVWTAMADIPADAYDGGVGGVGDGGSLLYVGFWLSVSTDYIYALSGNQAYPESIPDNRTYRYTMSTNSWERLADLPFEVGYYVGCRLGYADEHIYAWQGTPSTWTGGGDDLARYKLAWIVDDDGPADFHTIQEAMNAASPGDTIIVREGTYTENVDVNKSLTIKSESGAEKTIVQAANPNDHVFEVTMDCVNITGFTVKEATGYAGRIAGIHLSNVFGCNISKNNVSENTYGIYLDYSSGNILNNNSVLSNHYGIHLHYSDSNALENNTVSNHESVGIFLERSSNNVLRYNIMLDNWSGVGLDNSDSNTITDNTFVNNGIFIWNSYRNAVENNLVNGKPLVYLEDIEDYRVNIEAGQVILVNCNNVIVEGLNLSNTTVGVELWKTNDSKVTNNTVSHNKGYGIYLHDSHRNTLQENTVLSNQFGIELYNSNSNLVYLNNFVNNIYSFYSYNSTNIWHSPEKITYTYNGKTCTNYLGNYWSDYTGSDADGDGIGDTPYSTDSDKDNYPLMKPFEYYYIKPTGIRFPVDNPLDGEYWVHIPDSPGHRPGGGYRGADDTYALDLNWGPRPDSDLGKRVYAIERGTIKQLDRGWGWILIEHSGPLYWRERTHNVWYSGYLHMQNIPKTLKEGVVIERSAQIGEVGRKRAKTPHLHFAIYVGRVVDRSEPRFRWDRQNAFLESVDPGQVAGPEYANYTYGDRETIYEWGRGAIYNHDVDEFIAQDPKHWFEKGGSDSDWFETTSYGFYDHIFYTHTSKVSPDNWGRWNHEILIDGNYTILAFIPRNFANTRKATYRIYCNGHLLSTKRIAQSKYHDQWVELGRFDLKTGDKIRVELNDQTGESNKWVAYDLVKIWMKQDVRLPRTG